jgi:hypothetical protein
VGVIETGNRLFTDFGITDVAAMVDLVAAVDVADAKAYHDN